MKRLSKISDCIVGLNLGNPSAQSMDIINGCMGIRQAIEVLTLLIELSLLEKFSSAQGRGLKARRLNTLMNPGMDKEPA